MGIRPREKKHVKSSDGGIVLRHPRLTNSTEWVGDMRRWPQVSNGDIFYYYPRLLHASTNWLVLHKAKGMQVTDLVTFKTGNVLFCLQTYPNGKGRNVFINNHGNNIDHMYLEFRVIATKSRQVKTRETHS